MHPFDLHPEFYNKPILLKEEELANPIIVIQQFFDDYHLIEVRKHLHSLLEVAMTAPNTIYDDASVRDAVVCFCERVEKLVEAESFSSNHNLSI
jgi:hypothetical protein